MKSVIHLFIAVFYCFFILGCGGGGSYEEESDDPTAEEIYSISVSISQQDISAAIPATVTATVSSSKRGLLENELVTFSLNELTLGSFEPVTGTAITDANGQAQVQLLTSNIQGSGLVSASIYSQLGVNATQSFTMLGDGGVVGETQIVASLVDAAGNLLESISTKQAGKLTAVVTGSTEPVIVYFTTGKGEIPIGTAVTVDGVAMVDIYAGADLGAGYARASINENVYDEVIVVVGATNVFMGSGDSFTEGEAFVSLDTLAAGGTATVSVDIIDDEGNAFTEPVEVSFSSVCSSFSSPKAELSSPVIAVSGKASSTYLAQGCVGEDPINVTANAGGLNLAANASISVLAAAKGSIVFVGFGDNGDGDGDGDGDEDEDEEPKYLAIKNTGGAESLAVAFQVFDVTGLPMSNQEISFLLNTAVGGISLYPVTAMTNGEGIVQTTLTSGTVATSIRVTAYFEDYDISAQSSELVITTGIADQDSFSLSASNYSPEGWSIDGIEVKVTARLADAFNNPVPDGTAVTFRSEGGSIDDACFTTNGMCFFVTWRSQDVRPDGAYWGDPVHPADSNGYYDVQEYYADTDFGQPMGGRVTITAFTIGEESFADTNGNGRFDEDEYDLFIDGPNIQGDPFDMAEAFEDFNEDDVFNPEQSGGEDGGELEELIDFNSDGSFTLADGLYNGVLCALEGNSYCGSIAEGTASIHVRKNIVLVMSGSTAYASEPVITDSNSVLDTGSQIMDIYAEEIASLQMIVSDLHNQTLPSGSVISVSSSVGTLATDSSIIVQDRGQNGTVINASVTGSIYDESGKLEIKVTTPEKVVTQVASITVNITQIPAP
ncbi:hypothetical protein [Shewanella surugensis]|uniref:Big-1 domain-containing protein n=1 Tax=Shewanella surugensis TaxID=212020 RepID=A0ABT0LCF7_9GAMM|nr:hypothetical protein [Shewanella surugensis]MCL1125389.1 hypothetical protein [Shewanella surugensis]